MMRQILRWSSRIVTWPIAVTYAAFIIRMLVPLVSLPILSNRLSTHSLGEVLSNQSLALMGCIVMEWGYNLTGVRDVSAAEGPEALRFAVVRILSARVLLAPVVFGVVSIVALATGGFATEA